MYEVLRLEDSQNFTELESKVKEDFEKALQHIISGVTPKEDFPGERIPARPVRGGATVNYVPGWWFIQQANALFQHRWSFEVLEFHVGENQVYCKGQVTIPIPGYEETIEYPDGRKITKKVEGTTITKTQFGGTDIKRKTGTRDIIDIGDDLKSAATDAMKKCLTQFGFAPDIYGKRETQEIGTPSSSQLDALYATAEKAGMSREAVVELAQEEFGDRPAALREIEVLGLINKVRQKAGK